MLYGIFTYMFTFINLSHSWIGKKSTVRPMEHIPEIFFLVKAIYCDSLHFGVSCQGWKIVHMGVSKNSGTPKWMVYNGKHMENPINMDDLGGKKH